MNERPGEAAARARQPDQITDAELMGVSGWRLARVLAHKAGRRAHHWLTDARDLALLLSGLTGRARAGTAKNVVRAARLPAARAARRLKVLFITGEFPNPLHGGGGRVADFIRALGRQHDIYLYTVYDDAKDAAARRALEPYCRRIATADGYEAFAAGRGVIDDLIEGASIDITHYEWPRSLAVFDAGRGRFSIFTYMEAVSSRLLDELRGERVMSRRWRRVLLELARTYKVEMLDARRPDARLVTTQKDGEFYAQFNRRQEFFVVNHGVDFGSFELPELQPEAHSLTFVGHFGHRPNRAAVRYFMGNILPLIRDKVPDVRIYLVGADPTAEIRRQHDGERVIVTGQVADIRPYIQRARVCVAPLISGAGLRGKVIQYAALRRPCVATPIAATDMVFADGKDIWVADDPATFAERVCALLADPAMAEGMGQAAYATAKRHYEAGHLTQNLLAVYDRLGAWATPEARKALATATSA